MPPITTKDQLRALLLLRRTQVERQLARLTEEQFTRPGACGEWSAGDILAHLAEWQERNIGWVSTALRGETPQVPAPGLSWSRADVDRFNQQIYELHRGKPRAEVEAFFRTTFARFMQQFEAIREEDLFTPGRLPFMGARATPARWYREYAHHDGWARSRIHKALAAPPHI